MLTGRLAPTALVTNKGFEDILELGRQNRADIYALTPEKRLLPSNLTATYGVSARRSHNGQPLSSFEQNELQDLAGAIEKSGVEATAVALLFSYAEPHDEREIRKHLRSPDVSISSETLPIAGEYERVTATVLNAGLLSVMAPYLSSLEEELKKRHSCGRFYVLGSNGGNLPPETAARFPIRTLLSGPAGGAAAAEALAEYHGLNTAIALDIGGTSTDFSWIAQGSVSTREEISIAGLTVAGRRLGVETIGAGGGSIVKVIRGSIRVGPESAAAVPGPACYGAGGPATVTDCHLLLGHIPEITLGGGINLSRERSRVALAKLGREIDRSAEETAEIALETANHSIARACRKTAVAHGGDPSQAAIIAFGGAGPLHACALAEILQVRRCIVPAAAGVLSAVGMAISPEMMYLEESIFLPAADASPERWEQLTQRGREHVSLDFEFFELNRIAHCRYLGQNDTLPVPAASHDNIDELFQQEHERRYGFRRNRPVEIRDLGLVIKGPKPEMPTFRFENSSETAPPGGIHRHELSEGVSGVTTILDEGTTTYVPRGWRAKLQRGPWGDDILLEKV